MTAELQVFKYESNTVRITEIDGEAWFVGKDVAEILGYNNPQEAVRSHVDEDDKGVSEILTPGGRQKMPIINESGLYSLILSSKLPTAKKIKHWVTSEVLPTLRKTGSYDMESRRKRMSEFDQAMKHGREVYTSMGLRGKKLAVALDKIYRDYLGFSALERAGIDPDAPDEKRERTPMPEWKRRILDYLKENETITPQELSRLAGILPNTAGGHLKRMEKQGYLRKVMRGVYEEEV